MRRKRRNHSPAFKAKVAMAALQGDKTLAELSNQYDVHVNQIQIWRNQLKDGSFEIQVGKQFAFILEKSNLPVSK